MRLGQVTTMEVYEVSTLLNRQVAFEVMNDPSLQPFYKREEFWLPTACPISLQEELRT
jgi:hypothetical protein